MGGRKKSDPEAEEEAEAEEEEEEEEAEEEGEEEEEEEGEEKKMEEGGSKLDDGYYEIEDIRRKRVVKGQLQYLIKWRGWPETANTWEPYHNIQSCADIIGAFEERYQDQSRKRKRKRKSSLPVTITKKRRHKLNLQSQVGSSGIDEDSTAPTKDGNNETTADELQEDVTTERMEAKNQQVQTQELQKPEEHAEVDNDMNVQCNGADVTAGVELSVNIHSLVVEEDGSTSGVPTFKCPPPANQSAGARRRKSVRVKRFHPSSTAHEKVGVGMEDVDSPVDPMLQAGSKDPSPSVVKLLVPVEFSASMANNIQDVSVTFKALCSDGKEVLVTNKALKAINPQLLISFYEQHLRYGSS